MPEPSTIVQSFMGFLVFLPLILVGGIILCLLAVYYTPKAVAYFPWRRYGERMKLAYATKFGEFNIEFNKEVDNRILVMQTLGDSPTRHLAEDWLKSHAEFVEIPWMDL